MAKDAANAKIGRRAEAGQYVIRGGTSVFRVRKEADGSEVISLREATRKRANNAARIVLSEIVKKK